MKWWKTIHQFSLVRIQFIWFPNQRKKSEENETKNWERKKQNQKKLTRSAHDKYPWSNWIRICTLMRQFKSKRNWILHRISIICDWFRIFLSSKVKQKKKNCAKPTKQISNYFFFIFSLSGFFLVIYLISDCSSLNFNSVIFLWLRFAFDWFKRNQNQDKWKYVGEREWEIEWKEKRNSCMRSSINDRMRQ